MPYRDNRYHFLAVDDDSMDLIAFQLRNKVIRDYYDANGNMKDPPPAPASFNDILNAANRCHPKFVRDLVTETHMLKTFATDPNLRMSVFGPNVSYLLLHTVGPSDTVLAYARFKHSETGLFIQNIGTHPHTNKPNGTFFNRNALLLDIIRYLAGMRTFVTVRQLSVVPARERDLAIDPTVEQWYLLRGYQYARGVPKISERREQTRHIYQTCRMYLTLSLPGFNPSPFERFPLSPLACPIQWPKPVPEPVPQS